VARSRDRSLDRWGRRARCRCLREGLRSCTYRRPPPLLTPSRNLRHRSSHRRSGHADVCDCGAGLGDGPGDAGAQGERRRDSRHGTRVYRYFGRRRRAGSTTSPAVPLGREPGRFLKPRRSCRIRRGSCRVRARRCSSCRSTASCSWFVSRWPHSPRRRRYLPPSRIVGNRAADRAGLVARDDVVNAGG